MNQTLNGIRRILITILVAMGVGALFIVVIGENPIDAYAALFRGAFDGELRLGTTLAGFTPLLLTSIAFAVAAKAGAFNVGVEGEVFLGGITAAYIGINWTFLPKPALYVACFVGAMVVAAAWAFIPAVLRAYYNVNEVCTTILMNTVALYITSYLVSGPMSAGTANAGYGKTVSVYETQQCQRWYFHRSHHRDCDYFYASEKQLGLQDPYRRSESDPCGLCGN